MSRVISFRTDDEVAEVIEGEVDRADGDVSRAKVTKRLVEEAADARATPLWLQVGMSNRNAARLEDLRQQGETEHDLARELLAEALEARDRDVLDELELDDELRDRVEDVREDGETLDDAVRRLLRVGVGSTGNENSTSRYTAAGAVVLLGGVPTTLAAVGQVDAAFAAVATLFLWVLFGGVVSAGIENTRSRLGV